MDLFAVVVAIATSAGVLATVRKIVEYVLVWKVSTKDATVNSAQAAAMVLLALRGKIPPGLWAPYR